MVLYNWGLVQLSLRVGAMLYVTLKEILVDRLWAILNGKTQSCADFGATTRWLDRAAHESLWEPASAHIRRGSHVHALLEAELPNGKLCLLCWLVKTIGEGLGRILLWGASHRHYTLLRTALKWICCCVEGLPGDCWILDFSLMQGSSIDLLLLTLHRVLLAQQPFILCYRELLVTILGIDSILWVLFQRTYKTLPVDSGLPIYSLTTCLESLTTTHEHLVKVSLDSLGLAANTIADLYHRGWNAVVRAVFVLRLQDPVSLLRALDIDTHLLSLLSRCLICIHSLFCVICDAQTVLNRK